MRAVCGLRGCWEQQRRQRARLLLLVVRAEVRCPWRCPPSPSWNQRGVGNVQAASFPDGASLRSGGLSGVVQKRGDLKRPPPLATSAHNTAASRGARCTVPSRERGGSVVVRGRSGAAAVVCVPACVQRSCCTRDPRSRGCVESWLCARLLLLAGIVRRVVETKTVAPHRCQTSQLPAARQGPWCPKQAMPAPSPLLAVCVAHPDLTLSPSGRNAITSRRRPT